MPHCIEGLLNLGWEGPTSENSEINVFHLLSTPNVVPNVTNAWTFSATLPMVTLDPGPSLCTLYPGALGVPHLGGKHFMSTSPKPGTGMRDKTANKTEPLSPRMHFIN